MFRWPLTTTKGVEFELRLLELRDADELFALADANREHLRPWLPWIAWTYSAADVKKFLRSALKQFSEGDGFHAGVWVEGRLAGCVGLHPIDWHNRHVAIGYWLGREWEGHGLVTAGALAVTRYCFEELALERVEIRAATGNTRSRAVPERLGFTLEGTLRRVQNVDGRWLDNAVYSILRDEAGRLIG
ncbi:MAG TPA: GNAT family protein [Bryobacteraceae bacterium]|jgi:ribosomal-protein-serine acetyltransferase|nr:GNAT family protein [Bryobacteraceae bacterium]